MPGKVLPPYSSRGLGMEWFDKPAIRTKPIASEMDWVLYVGFDLFAFAKWRDAMTFLELNYDRILKDADRNRRKWKDTP